MIAELIELSDIIKPGIGFASSVTTRQSDDMLQNPC